ncbi:MAG TPA: glycosyltransferase family 87 protein, partial [Chloroflexota bacterium]
RARVGPIAVAAATVALVAWMPVAFELNFGQLTMPALALLAAARLAQARGRPALAGVLIGLAILLKPTPWPVVLLLAAHRQWRLVGASIATVALGFGAAAAVMGPATIVRYFVVVLPWVNRVYATTVQNMSLWSVGWRLFYGTRGIGGVGFDSPPLVDAPALAPIAAALLPAGLLAVALLWSLRRPGVDICLGVGAALSALLSPVGWSFYAVLAIIAAWQIALAVQRHGYPRQETNWALLAALAGAVGWPVLIQGWLSPTLAASGNLALSFPEAQTHLAWTVSILIIAALAALLGARGLVGDPVAERRQGEAAGGPMPTGTSGSLPRSARAPRLGGIYVRLGRIEGAKLT